MLKDFIVAAYVLDEFSALLLEELPDDADFDFDGLSPRMSFEVKVLEAVKWANRFGGPQRLLWLAEAAAKRRAGRPDAGPLVAAIRGVVTPAGNGAAPAPGQLPTEFITTLDIYRLQPSLPDLAADLRAKLRARPYEPFDLPGRFHLSESNGERLAAIIALEVKPDRAYMRWLSERVTIEPPPMAYVAAKALVSAARQFAPAQLPAVASAIAGAADRLDKLEDDPAAPAEFEPDARRQELLDAKVLIGMRTREQSDQKSLPPADVDRFLTAMQAAFDLPALEALCRKHLQTDLNKLVKPTEPVEHVVVGLLVKARRNRWEGDLIRAARAERPGDPAFGAAFDRYV